MRDNACLVRGFLAGEQSTMATWARACAFGSRCGQRICGAYPDSIIIANISNETASSLSYGANCSSCSDNNNVNQEEDEKGGTGGDRGK